MILDRLLRRGAATAGRARPSVSSRSDFVDEEIDDAFLNRLRRVALQSQRRLTAGPSGEHPSPRRAHALEFADYRAYTPGDDFRRVDWNAYLRLDQLLVKLAEAPERVALHLLLDASRSMAWGRPSKFGYSRRLAVALSYVALSHLDTVNMLVLDGGECSALLRQESTVATGAVVRAVNGLCPGSVTDLDASIRAYSTMGNHRGVAVLISDLLSPAGYRSGLEHLSRSSLRSVVVHVLSREEMEPSLEGDFEMEDVETGDTIQVSVNWDTLNRYKQWLREWLDEVQAFCARKGITYVRVETSQPIDELLLGRLRREKILS